MSTTIPPFAPVLDAEAEAAKLLLSQGERKRTGHLYKDCPALDVVAPGKAKACKPCLARFAEVGALARTHQRQFDAAWYAQAAAADQPMPVAAVAATFDADVWEPVEMTTVGAGKSYAYEVPRNEPRVDRFEAASGSQAKPIKPNRYGGRCPLCSQWVEEGAGALIKLPTGKWGAQHLDGACPAPKAPTATAERTSDPAVAEGYYALETKEDARQPVAFYHVEHGKAGGKWEGFTFLTRLIGGQGYVPVKGGAKASILARIAADPLAASVLYGRTSGRCGRCNTELSDASSIEAGIGPVCASKAW